ncbi:MAG: AAA family ATPase [Planctomycetes bacterium]|nr:AAA family ATPase [Planctomycetota bacterium]
MDDALRKWVDDARSGRHEAFDALVRALTAKPAVSPAVLAELARASEAILRRAAATASAGRDEAEVIEVLVALAADVSVEVRKAVSASISTIAAPSLDSTCGRLLHDPEPEVRAIAARAAATRPSLAGDLVDALHDDAEDSVREAAASALASVDPALAIPELVFAFAFDVSRPVAIACATSLETLFTTIGDHAIRTASKHPMELEEGKKRLAAYGRERYPRLAAWIDERVRTNEIIDDEKLTEFGTDLTAEAKAGRLLHAHGVDAICDATRRVLTGRGVRSAVLLGPTGAGKTIIVNEVVHRLLEDPSGPWRVLRVSPSELLAGTKFLGEWQTKIRSLVEAAKLPRRVILYVPNLQELSWAGRSSDNATNIATMLAPHIEDGSIAVLGESTAEAFRTGLGTVASLRRLFAPIEVREAGPVETRLVLRAVRDELAIDASDSTLDRLVELADLYLAGAAQPGRAVGLLRRVVEGRADGHRTGSIAPREVLDALSTSTGIPVDFLDDDVPLDLARTRAFFEGRVMGQAEAVDAIVDLVALVKAGLTDPGKPFGVLLFVGPTGVGKTELARALAEMLFGDPTRLVRFDMSEFASYSAYERLIGTHGSPGLLTSSVRERPFSVLLFDEIEKAHLNVFDLCLQIFDAGRLTDSQGTTADFRRTIIVMTSNVGSSVPIDSSVGFGNAPPRAPESEDVLRELRNTFRPEFLNRIDRIVAFRPLEAETAQKIARREVSRVIERSGVARRQLIVDVAPAVLALLLREGYSPAFGARPLKRTVERLLLLPVARAIASGKVLPGSLLRLEAKGDAVSVTIVPPESADTAGDARDAEPTRDERTLRDRAAAMAAEVAALPGRAASLSARKAALLQRSAQSGFWNDRATALRELDEIHRLDGVLSALDALERAVVDARVQMERPETTGRRRASLEERFEALECEAKRVAFLVDCRDVRDLGDAMVTLTLVKSQGSGLDAVKRLAEMYVGFAKRRGLEVEVLDDRSGGEPHEDKITMLVSGAGAHALYAGEAGLHRVLRSGRDTRAKGGRRDDRDVVRVDVLPAPWEDVTFAAGEVRVESHALRGGRGRLLAKPKLEVTLLHVPSMTAVHAWTDGTRNEAMRRLEGLLRARIDAAKSQSVETSSPQLVRRYVLGPSPLVRDTRTGRSTGRLDRVLAGDLDLFVLPMEKPART